MNTRYCILVCLLAGSLAQAQVTDEPRQFEAVCRPSKEVTLAFTRPGQIEDIFVRVGDRVEEGELLVQLENGVEVAQVEQLKNEAEDRTRIEAAEAELEQAQVDLDKMEDAWGADEGRRAVTKYELDHARLNVKIKKLSLKLAKFNQDQSQLRYEEAALQLKRMQIESPISGTVEILYVEAGESIDQLQEVLHVVGTDPLWIDVPLPLDVAAGLAPGSLAKVRLSTAPGDVIEGEVIFVASIADAASRTRRVRVELPNTAGEPAGQKVVVSFPPAEAEPEASASDTAEIASEEATAEELLEARQREIVEAQRSRWADNARQPTGETVPDETDE